MWRPGQLVTINGVVYRVKREHELFTSCQQCAFGGWLFLPRPCSFPAKHYERYPLPEDCYLKRESPIKRKPLIMKVNYYE